MRGAVAALCEVAVTCLLRDIGCHVICCVGMLRENSRSTVYDVIPLLNKRKRNSLVYSIETLVDVVTLRLDVAA